MEVKHVLHHTKKITVLLIGLLFVFSSVLFADKPARTSDSVTLTSEADFSGAEVIEGLDYTTSSGSLSLNTLSLVQDPATETRNLAVLVPDDTALDSDLEFNLTAYFPNFTYDGSGTDDVFDFTEITNISDLSGYDVVVTDATTTTNAGDVPQDILDQFADAGGTVVQGLMEYSIQRQIDTYNPNINYDLDAGYTNIRDIAYDGTNMWLIDDTTDNEKIVKLDTSTGTALETYCVFNNSPRGIEYLAGNLYVTDTWNDRIYVIDPANLTTYTDGTCRSVADTEISLDTYYPSPTLENPGTIATDGTNFYMLETTADSIYKFTIDAGVITPVTDFALALNISDEGVIGSTPKGIAHNGTNLWLADQNRNVIYNLDDTLGTVLEALDSPDFGATDVDPFGVTFVDGSMWVVDGESTLANPILYNWPSYFLDKDAYEYFRKGNVSFETPASDPKGLVYAESYFWLVDDSTNKLYKLNPADGTEVLSCFTPGPRPNGLAYYGNQFFISDYGTADKIYVIDATTITNGTDCPIVTSYATPSISPKGLAHDGTNLWHADTNTDLIYKLNPADGSVLSSFSSPGGAPRGLAYYNGDLWVADELADSYYQLDITDGSIIREKNVYEFSAEGITFKDGELWSVDDLQDRVYNVDSGRLAKGQFDTPANLNRGIVYDGTNVWITDIGTDKFYKLNKADFSVVTEYASPALDPMDLAWDGTNLWLTTDSDDKIYKINPADGVTITSFAAQGTSTYGITYDGTYLYTDDFTSNKVYRISPTDGSLVATFDSPGSAAGPLAFDGSYVWQYDTDERALFELEFDDDDEGIIKSTSDVYTTSIFGIEFIDGVMWSADSYFDSFFNSTSLYDKPIATVVIANDYTYPYSSGDYFYNTTRNTDEGYYLHRRIINVPETGGREVLATSNRGGAVYVHEARSNGGHIFSLDLTLVGINYEVAQQTVPVNTLFLDSLGIETNLLGVHENTRPTYTTLTNDLDTLVANNPTLFVQEAEGLASNGDTIYSYNFGTTGKPMVIFVSGVHGNEEHPYIAEIRYMQRLADLYNADDPVAKDIFENYYVKFIPLVNQYGIRNLIRYNANGVDINRNYDYNWALYPSGYSGTSAFSEPESQVLRDIILANQSNLVLVNDAHSAMAISPGISWGIDLGGDIDVAPNQLLQDIYTINTTEAARRWYDERASVGRWLVYDRFQPHPDKPYFGNWLGSLGISSSTNEVLGKKDIGTERMLHTTSWYINHFESVMKTLAYQKGKAIFKVDVGEDALFDSAISATATTPGTSEIDYRYSSNTVDAVPTVWYSDYTEVPAGSYLYVESTLSRDSYTVDSPTINDLSISYATATGGSSLFIYPWKPLIQEPEVLSANSIKWNFVENSYAENGVGLADELDETILEIEGADYEYIDEEDLIPNTQYVRKVYSYNINGKAYSDLSSAVYTFAEVPEITNVEFLSGAGIKITIDPKNNPDYTRYAIFEENSEMWLGNSNVLTKDKLYLGNENNEFYIVGLNSSDDYAFKVMAINEDNVETVYSNTMQVNLQNQKIDEVEDEVLLKEVESTATETIPEVKKVFSYERDLIKEQKALKIFSQLFGYLPEINNDWKLLHFIAYGSMESDFMTDLQRGALLKEYDHVYGNLPVVEAEWQALAEILINQQPEYRKLSKESASIGVFTQIFNKVPEFKADWNFINWLTYPFRNKNRDLNRETTALETFINVYGKIPKTSQDWAIIRALSYSMK